jgi:hypothetical protein
MGDWPEPLVGVGRSAGQRIVWPSHGALEVSDLWSNLTSRDRLGERLLPRPTSHPELPE